MTLSASPGAYHDCYAVMTAAIEDQHGVRVRMPSADAAVYFRMRCNQARAIDRRKNAETYDKTHPLHGTSEFDRLSIKLEQADGEAWVRFEVSDLIPGDIESLTTGEIVATAVPPPKPAAPAAPMTDEELGDAFEAVPVVPTLRRL